MPELQDEADRKATAKTNTTKLGDFLQSESFTENLRQILPGHLSGDRFATIAFRQFSTIPELKLCSMESVAGSIMQAASLGLEIATQGHAWLIPREVKKGSGNWEASLQIGYLGHLDLAWRSGQVKSIMVDVVIEGDKFKYQRGTQGFLHHVPKKGRIVDPAKIEFAYAIVATIQGGEVWMCIDRTEIERIRNSGPSHNSPAWRDWYDQMAMGKVLKRTLKFCPRSAELGRAIAIDDRNDANLRPDFEMDVSSVILPAEAGRFAPGMDAVMDKLRQEVNAEKSAETKEPVPASIKSEKVEKDIPADRPIVPDGDDLGW